MRGKLLSNYYYKINFGELGRGVGAINCSPLAPLTLPLLTSHVMLCRGKCIFCFTFIILKDYLKRHHIMKVNIYFFLKTMLLKFTD